MLHRYPFLRQHDGSDCGCASLAMVCLYHRRSIAREQLRDLTGTDRVGTNLLGLARAAEKLGFSAKGVEGEYDELRQIPLPAVAHLLTERGEGHFVVLYRVDRKGVLIGDPARPGVEQMPAGEFRRTWTGKLLLLNPRPEGTPGIAAAAPAGPWRRMARLLWGQRLLMLEALLCALCMSGLALGMSFFLQHLVDHVLVLQQWKLLHGLGCGMLLVLLFTALFGVLRQYLLAFISRRVDLALVGGYVRHVLHLPLSFFETRRVGEIISRAIDAQKIREAISGTALTATVDGTLVVVSLIVLWIYDWPLALAATAFVPLAAAAVLLHLSPARRLARSALGQAAVLSSHMVEDASGAETIKAFGVERARAEEGQAHLVKTVQSVFRLQGINISITALTTLITGAAGIAILWYGGARVMQGALTIGELVFFYSMLMRLLEPLKNLASVNLSLQEAAVAVDRMYQILDVEQEQFGDPRKARFSGLAGEIELAGVDFRYGHRESVLNGLSLTIPAGKTVAIVGESGCGKSTLLKLLMGFYQPVAGRVLVDGVDLRDIDAESLRRRIGLVAQDPFIFNATLRDNILLGNPSATMPEVSAAAAAAGLEEFIARLPQRMDTVIGERGANLSGGERQRLAIARALLRDPDILLFDEATSHLDTVTELAIQESLRRGLSGKTVVLVAHRLSTIRRADLICVMHEGRIVEQGSHEELCSRNGRYAELWRSNTGAETPRHDFATIG